MSHPEAPHGTSSEEAGRLVLALKASNEGIWDWWVGDPEIYYSRRILEFLECSGSSAPNLFLEPHSTIHPDDRDRFALALQSVLSPSGPDVIRRRKMVVQ